MHCWANIVKGFNQNQTAGRMALQHLFGGISECCSSLARHRLSNVLRLRSLSEVIPALHKSTYSPLSTSIGICNGQLYSRLRVAYNVGREGIMWTTDTLTFGLLSTTRSRINVQMRYFHNHVIKMPPPQQQMLHSHHMSTSTAVTKDVILFEHDRTRFFRLLAVFCVGQLLFWTYLAHFAYTGLRDTGGRRSEGRQVSTTGLAGFWSFDMNLGSNAWRHGFTLACLVIGGGIMGLGLLFCCRSVSQVILHKGAGKVTVSTQSPLGADRGWRTTVPLSQVSCYAHREESPSFIPLRVKGHKFFFLLDREGTLNNPKLFDVTVGAYRPF